MPTISTTTVGWIVISYTYNGSSFFTYASELLSDAANPGHFLPPVTFSLPFDLTGGGHAFPADLNGDGLLDFLTDFGGPGVFIQAKIATS